MKTISLIVLSLALSSGAAFATETPWTGTWKLDADKSHLTGQTFSYSKGPGELLHYEDGSTASFDFGLDGKEYKTWANRVSTWTAAGKNTWDFVSKADGKVLSKGHVVLSEDGKTLTMIFTGTRPDGEAFREEDVYTRVSGTDGLLGTWRTEKVKEPSGPQTFVISSPAPGVLHYEIPDMKASAEGRVDGSDNRLSGPTVPPGSTISFQALTPTKLKYVMKINGKIDNTGEQTIAADGRSFSDVNWNPGKESEKATSVYVKQ
jgi:hypothetical protein